MSREMRDWLGRAASPVRERWRTGSAGSTKPASTASSAEARAGALFAQAVQRDPLPPERLAAIADRLRSQPKRRRAAPPKLVVRLAAGLTLLIVGGALAATATHYFNLPHPFGRPSQPSPRPPVPARRPPPGHVGQGDLFGASSPLGNAGELDQPPPGSVAEAKPLTRRIQRPAPVSGSGEDHVPTGRNIASREHPPRPPQRSAPLPSPSASPSPSPPPSPSPVLEPSVAPPPEARLAPLDDSSPAAPRQPVPPASPAPPPRTALAEESALVMSALTALRRQDDAGRALAILDGHDRRFPRGDLADEAALARVEALVKLKRSEEALALLEARGPSRRGNSQRKLVLTRAELRAASGRCAAALDDLDALLRGAPPGDAVTERALWGRAACRASRGQADSARADLQSYLRLFPSGQFASAARVALEPDRGGRPASKP